MGGIIAVTGKGGTGKTTIAALIIKYLKENVPGPILALDADPDANLATVLGIPVGKTLGDLREETLAAMKNLPAGMSKSSYIEAGLHEIIVECEKFDLITMGRSEGPGCYCYINNLFRKFGDDLHPSYQWLVMDNEAGLEHLSRRTATRVDNLIVVVNETPLSIDCARRVQQLLQGIKNEVKRTCVLLNNVGAEKEEQLRARVDELGMERLGCIPHDPAVEEAIFAGKSLFELDSSPAVHRIEEIMRKLGE